MENASLTKAHDHARAASIATQTSDTTVAINEHALAAGEFSNAARTTASIEALRTLRLLEQHHKRLSELLKFPHEQTSQPSSIEGEIPEEDEKQLAEEDGNPTNAASKPPSVASAPSSAKAPPTLSHQRSGRYPGRDLSSSIASNLASARGIKTSKYRGQPLTPSISNDQAPGSLEVHPRREGSVSSKNKLSDSPDGSRKPSWIPPSQPTGPKTEPTSGDSTKVEQGGQGSSDEGFSRFYNTFGSIINRLSAPLAFAGLPLINEETSGEAPTVPPPESHVPKRHRQHKSVTSASVEPDLSKIYSKATLRALAKDGHAPTDSFYVVPPSGHTVSYANILSFDQKERRRLAASGHGDEGDGLEEPDEDDFVDARESQGPLSPGLRRQRPGRTQTEREQQNVIEELHLENASLKEMLDKLSKRLHAFELNSQSSHLALAQSIRLGRPGSPLSGSGGAADSKAEDTLRSKNQALEDQLAEMMKNMQALEKEYEKTLATVEKYRDRWEKLKAGAKARREAQVSAETGEASKGA
ncbi:hypothetical protein GQ53DRAFT_378971 [Thozetella sp. PMI_491]|nr:hypothetical protein GQ53DRAFT_378971 [Thozetella sp. PMI_491]